MQIVHISDLHHGKHSGSKQLVQAIIDHYRAQAHKPKVVLTGDLVESALDKREMHEVKEILSQLPAAGFDLLICPGNHDLKIKGGAGNPLEYLHRFHKYFGGLLPTGVNYLGEEDNDLLDYPLVHQFDDHFFVGLNSLEGRPFFTRGKLGKHQLQELEQALKNIRERHPSPTIIIYLHNNPFRFNYRYFFLKLNDRRAFRRIVRGVNVLLSGHWHWNLRYPMEEKKYDINCIQVTGRSNSSARFVAWTEIETIHYESREVSYPK